jgi:SAM-dependent methyltransferase
MSSSHMIFYPETAFGGFSDIDGTVAFYSRINALVEPTSRMVDFGCGRGERADDPIPFRRNLTCFKGKAASVVGIDIDSAGYCNPMLDEFRQLAPDSPWPVEDKSVEIVVCDHVIEHLPDPDSFFRESARVLVKGGYLCIRTPNVLSYVGVISKLVPNGYHKQILSRAQPARKDEDVFPTLYRCNTVFTLRRHMAKHRFRAVAYGFESEPRYLSFSKFAYALGVLHQKFAPGFMRPAIFAFGQAL